MAMAEVPTHFPPQTYSSSFFLNAIPEDDKVGNKIKVKNKDEPSQSSPILDCFMKTMFLILVLGILPLTMANPNIQCTSVIPSESKVRVFPNLVAYQGNKITFDATKHEFQGNFIKIQNMTSILEKNSFNTFESDYAIRLILDNTGIRTVSNESFLQLFCLESLELQGNVIDTIEPNALEGLGHLRYLNLSRNLLQRLPVNLFDNMTHLKTLDLSFNKMHTFDCTLRNLGWLTHLNLSHNFLTTVDFKNWELNSLQVLDATYNDLSHIDLWAQFSYHSMSRLLLSHNLLKKLNIFSIRKMAPNLALLTLDGNSWSCDTLSSMVRALHDSRIIYQALNKTPSHINGIDCTKTDIPAETTVAPVTVVVPTPAAQVVNVTKLTINNEEVLKAISDLKSVVVYLFTFLLMFVIFEVVIRTGFVGKVIRHFRRGDEVLFDNGSVENIRLLPSSNRL